MAEHFLTTAKLNTSDARVAPSPCSQPEFREQRTKCKLNWTGESRGKNTEALSVAVAASTGAPRWTAQARRKLREGGMCCALTFITSGASQRCRRR